MCLLPSLDFVTSGRFKLMESTTLVSPMSRNALRFHLSEAISLTAVSAAAETSREQTASIIKQIMHKFVEFARGNKELKLGFGFGNLICQGQVLVFENCAYEPVEGGFAIRSFSHSLGMETLSVRTP